MGAKRKKDNLMALAVLSVLMQRPMHPYEMALRMRSQGKEHDMEIKWGSLYVVVQNLAKNGHIEPVETIHEGRRPARTVYCITDAGKQRMVEWTRELLSVHHVEHSRFAAGIGMMTALHPNEVVELLRQRLESVNKFVGVQKEELARYLSEIPKVLLAEVEYRIAMAEAESAWMGRLIEELAAGNYPDLEMWSKSNEAGAIPQELLDLAERSAARASEN
ncbi:PadR family transcriptional regulator [Nocardia sp. NPDC051990]|uniref:PadR family transcriptional regulator n=1 Tax=Nocardia sp. NPDC051990 TaxID=3155285 RepID=UPI0034239555